MSWYYFFKLLYPLKNIKVNLSSQATQKQVWVRFDPRSILIVFYRSWHWVLSLSFGTLFYYLQKYITSGQQGGSAGKGPFHQAWKFGPWNSHGRGKENCPLASMCAQWHSLAHTRTHKYTNTCKWIQKDYFTELHFPFLCFFCLFVFLHFPILFLMCFCK